MGSSPIQDTNKPIMKTQKQSILFTTHQIEKEIKRISEDIKRNESLYQLDNPVYICVLNGAFMFFSDLVKNLNNGYIDFIKARSYEDTTQGDLEIISDIRVSIKGKRVYLIDDIYDSGNTIKSLETHLNKYEPQSIIPVTLFKRGEMNIPGLIYGFELLNEYHLVGYGLDGKYGLKRNQPFITGIEDDLN